LNNIWSRRSEISGVPLDECLGEGFALGGPEASEVLELGDLNGNLVVTVLHLLARVVMVVTGGIDLGEQVIDDVVGTLEDAIGNGWEVGRVASA
jgi:hypothetical protein